MLSGQRVLEPPAMEPVELPAQAPRSWSPDTQKQPGSPASARARPGPTPDRRDHDTTFERFTDRARRVLVLAQEEARLLDHGFIGTEHILLGLLHEGQDVAAQALSASGVTLEDMRERIERTVGGRGAGGTPPFTPRSKKVLELSLREALQLGHSFIGTGHLLLGLLREGEGAAAQVLVAAGTDLNELRAAVVARLGGDPMAATPEQGQPPRRCSFCGRQADAAAHFVSAPNRSVICSDCIAEAVRSLESAGDQAEVFLPIRIAGEPPDEEAVAAIVAVIDAAFVSEGSLANRRAAVEDFEELQPFLTLATRAGSITATAVARVRFVDTANAVVDFQTFAGQAGTYRTVRVARHAGRWHIPYDAMRTLLGELGVAVPRRPGPLGAS